jgi:hypothetical protein
MWSLSGSLFAVSRRLWILQLCHVILLTAETFLTSSHLSKFLLSLQAETFQVPIIFDDSGSLKPAETSSTWIHHAALLCWKGCVEADPLGFVLSVCQLSRVPWKLVNAKEYGHLKELFVVYIATSRRSIFWNRYGTKNETKERRIEGRAQGIKTEPGN